MTFNDPFANGGAAATPQNLDFDFEMPEENLVPEGTYVAKVAQIEKGETKNGDPKLVWDFTILAAADPSGQNSIGEVLSLHAVLSEKAMWRLQQCLVAVGLVAPGERRLKFSIPDALNRMVFITIKHREFQGRGQADIDQVLPYSELGKKHIGGMGGMLPPAPTQPTQPPAPRPAMPPPPSAPGAPAPASPEAPRRPPRQRPGKTEPVHQAPPPVDPVREDELETTGLDEEYQDDEFGAGEAGTVEN